MVTGNINDRVKRVQDYGLAALIPFMAKHRVVIGVVNDFFNYYD